MKNANELVISYPLGVIRLTLGVTQLESATLDAVGVVVKKSADDIVDLIFYNQGINMVYENRVARSVFLYINPDSGYTCFKGVINFLPPLFFENPDRTEFEKHLRGIGFERFWKAYPCALDMVRPGLRIRYDERPYATTIVIDDGTRLPACPSP